MDNLITLHSLAKMIDHSLLHPTLTDAEILQGCDLARRYDVATVCVKPYAVRMCKERLANTQVKVCSVIGFPHGNSATAIKVAETELALKDGAVEIDMVINIGKALGGDWDFVRDDIQPVNQVCMNHNAILKVIFENDYLQKEHIIQLCQICSKLNVAFVKTSTGYGFKKQANGDYNYRGATDEHIQLMRQSCTAGVQIKAAGGVRSLDDLLKCRRLGVTRIGATATAAILDEATRRGYPA